METILTCDSEPSDAGSTMRNMSSRLKPNDAGPPNSLPMPAIRPLKKIIQQTMIRAASQHLARLMRPLKLNRNQVQSIAASVLRQKAASPVIGRVGGRYGSRTGKLG